MFSSIFDCEVAEEYGIGSVKARKAASLSDSIRLPILASSEKRLDEPYDMRRTMNGVSILTNCALLPRRNVSGSRARKTSPSENENRTP